jgi:hypothetical protein
MHKAEPPGDAALLRGHLGRSTRSRRAPAARWARLVLARLHALQPGQGDDAGQEGDPRPRLGGDRWAEGGAPARDHPRERRGVPDLGAADRTVDRPDKPARRDLPRVAGEATALPATRSSSRRWWRPTTARPPPGSGSTWWPGATAARSSGRIRPTAQGRPAPGGRRPRSSTGRFRARASSSASGRWRGDDARIAAASSASSSSAANPFVIPVTHRATRAVAEPLRTVTAAHGANSRCASPLRTWGGGGDERASAHRHGSSEFAVVEPVHRAPRPLLDDRNGGRVRRRHHPRPAARRPGRRSAERTTSISSAVRHEALRGRRGPPSRASRSDDHQRRPQRVDSRLPDEVLWHVDRLGCPRPAADGPRASTSPRSAPSC